MTAATLPVACWRLAAAATASRLGQWSKQEQAEDNSDKDNNDGITLRRMIFISFAAPMAIVAATMWLRPADRTT